MPDNKEGLNNALRFLFRLLIVVF